MRHLHGGVMLMANQHHHLSAIARIGVAAESWHGWP